MKSTSLTLVCSIDKALNIDDLTPGITVDTKEETVIQASIIINRKIEPNKTTQN